MKKIFVAILMTSGLFPIVTAHTIQPADATLNCAAIESLGTTFNPAFKTQINNQVGGSSHKINRRKTLKIHEVSAIDFSGCRVNLTTDVTLKRRIRRDAHGIIKMRADITSVDIPAKKICYTNAKVTDVSLSRTLGIGERVYQWAANKALPNGGCFDI